MIRILNTEPLGFSAEAKNILMQIGKVEEASLNRQELLARLPKYDVIIVRLGNQIDREIIDAGTSLKVIVSPTTGLDHIDTSYAADKGVGVLSLKGETEFLSTISATAEHTWGLLLSLLRRIPQAFVAVQNNKWDRDAFRGRELAEKKLGILGLGRLGKKVSGYGLAFGMKVAAYDPYITEWAEGVEHMSTLNDLLSWSDVLSIHVPLNDETRGMIGKNEFAQLPLGAVIVNTARGQVINETELIAALKQKQLAGAALDVISDERSQLSPLTDSPLLLYSREHDNLLITPHIGGATYESMAKTEVFMANKLAGYLKA